MTSAFKTLCFGQFIIAFLLIVFGFVDRVVVKLTYSYVMFPIWVAILAGIAGGWCIMIANFHRRRGFLGPNMVSGLRAINIVCAAIAFYALTCHGQILALLAFTEAKNSLTSNSETFSTKEAITAILMILFIAEIFCGVFLALLNKESMFMGSAQPLQQQVPVTTNYGAPFDPRQSTMPTHNFSAHPEQQQ